MQYNILVCDDDKAIVDAIAILLSQSGYHVLKAYDGEQVIKQLGQNETEIHLLILDVMMPQKDGLSALVELRQKHNLPVIVLSAKSQDADKVIGLDFGADDYMTKPYNPLELLARVKSQLRRYATLGGMEKSDALLQVGGLVLNSEEKWVKVDGENVSLTATEFQILQYLMRQPGRVFSIEQIYEGVWGEAAYNANNTVAVHIRRIREKIEIEPRNPKYLKVVWGIGYKIERI